MGLTRIRADQISNIGYTTARLLADSDIAFDGSAPNTVDGVQLLKDDRVLLIGQEQARENGIYRVDVVGTGSNGTWSRAPDFNQTSRIQAGLAVMVTEGAEYDDTLWKLVTNDPIVVNETALDFRRNSAFDFGNIVANGTAIVAGAESDTVTFTAGNNVVITGNADSKTVDFSVKFEPSGNTGEIQFNNNGVLAASSNLKFTGNTVEVGADIVPTIDLTYDLGNATRSWRSLYVGGNTIFLGGIQLKDTGDNTLDIVSADGQTPAKFAGRSANADFANSAAQAATVTASAQPNITSVGTLASLSVTGNISGNFILGNGSQLTGIDATSIQNGTSNVKTFKDGNVVVSSAGNANIAVFTGNGLVISGTIEATTGFIGLDATAISNGTSSVKTFANANIELSAGNGSTVITVTGDSVFVNGDIVTSENITSGNISANSGTFTDIEGTLITAAQPNITSVGTLTSLAVTGNVTSGNLSGTTVSGTTGTFTNVAGNGSALSHLSAANIVGTVANATYADNAGLSSLAVAANVVLESSQPNITSVGTLTSLSVTGNVAAGNIFGTDGTFTAVTGNGRTVTSLDADNIDTGTLSSNRLSGSYSISVTSAATAATVTDNAQPNITSVGSLSSLDVVGNLSVGNLSVSGIETTGAIIVNGDATVIGNLTVQGNTITTNIDEFLVSNPLIQLGRGANDTPLISNDGFDRGMKLYYYDTAERIAFIGYDNDQSQLTMACCVDVSNNTVTINNWGTAKLGNVISTGTGDFVGNVAAGNMSATTGSFTTVAGNGRALTSLNASNIDTGIVPAGQLSGSYTIDIVGAATTAGAVTTAAQPNITSVGTLTSLAVTGNVTANANIDGVTITASGNITGENIAANANIDGVTITASETLSGNNAVITNDVSATSGTFIGNVVANKISANNDISSNTISVVTVAASGNITAQNITSNANISGLTVTASGNLAGNNAVVTNDVSADTLTANSSALTGNLTAENITANADVAGVTVTASGNLEGNNAVITNDVSTTTITASGNVVGENISANTISAQAQGEVRFFDSSNSNYVAFRSPGTVAEDIVWTLPDSDGIAGQLLSTNGQGALSWITEGEIGGVITWATQANTAPATPGPGDFWFNPDNQVKYQYINDGQGNAWVDQSFPTVFETVSTGSIINTNANGIGNIGTSAGYFNTVFAKATSAQYADLAEIYQADDNYDAGTVLVFGGVFEVTASTTECDTRVAGVVSTNPAYIMNSGSDGIAVALTGRVPCRVKGPVNKGDVLITSKTNGTAQRIGDQWYPGCVIGKSLEDISDDSIKLIEIAVGRF